MYVKHKETGEYFCFNEALMDTGKFERVEHLPKAEPAAVEAPAAEPEQVKPAAKHRQPKGK